MAGNIRHAGGEKVMVTTDARSVRGTFLYVCVPRQLKTHVAQLSASCLRMFILMSPRLQQPNSSSTL